jgi:hypothetical protein
MTRLDVLQQQRFKSTLNPAGETAMLGRSHGRLAARSYFAPLIDHFPTSTSSAAVTFTALAGRSSANDLGETAQTI